MAHSWSVDRSLVVSAFADDVDELLDSLSTDWDIVQGWRSSEEQTVLYQAYVKGKGQLAAPPGLSAHEYGLAVDVCLMENGKPQWDYHAAGWRELVAAVHAAPRLHSLDALGDTDHIERLDWREFAAGYPRA